MQTSYTVAAHVISGHQVKTLDTADNLRGGVMEKGGLRGSIFDIDLLKEREVYGARACFMGDSGLFIIVRL